MRPPHLRPPAADRPLLPARVRDDGFTLVEMMVGLILLAMLLAMVSGPLVNALSGSSSTSATAAAQRTIEDATDRFSTDVMAAHAPDRDRNRLRADSKFTKALTQGGDIYSDDPTDPPNQSLDVYDILTATPTMLRLRADVLATSPGTECVTWVSSAATSATFTLRRIVRAGTSCDGGAVQSDSTLVKDAPRVPGVTDATAFRYGVLAPDCRVRERATVTGVDRNRIVGVHLRVGTIVQRGTAASGASTAAFVSIRSRDASDYRRALGC